MAKSFTSVFLAGLFLFVRSNTFADVSFSYRMYRKNESKKTQARVFFECKREFFETDNQACTGHVTFCYSPTSWTLVSHAWMDRVWVHS